MKRWSKKICMYTFQEPPFPVNFVLFQCVSLSPRVRDSTKTVSWLSFALVQKRCVSPFANPAHFSPVCTETGLHLIPASRSNDAFQRSPLLTLLSLVYSSLSRFALLFQDHASFFPLSPSFIYFLPNASVRVVRKTVKEWTIVWSMRGATCNVAGETIYRAFDSCLDYFRHDGSIEIREKNGKKRNVTSAIVFFFFV